MSLKWQCGMFRESPVQALPVLKPPITSLSTSLGGERQLPLLSLFQELVVSIATKVRQTALNWYSGHKTWLNTLSPDVLDPKNTSAEQILLDLHPRLWNFHVACDCRIDRVMKEICVEVLHLKVLQRSKDILWILKLPFPTNSISKHWLGYMYKLIRGYE